MNGYLLCIVGTVLLTSILTAILPDGKTSAVVKGIAKLVCLLTIVAPIPKFLQSGRLFDEKSEENFSKAVIQTDEEFIKYYCEMRVRNAERVIESELAEKFSVQTNAKISWRFENENDWDSDEIFVTKIMLIFEGETDEKEKTAVWEYLTKNYCSEVLIE